MFCFVKRLLLWVISMIWAFSLQAHDLVEPTKKLTPSVVGVGTFLKTRSPANQLRGTGFVIGDGRFVATNAHVLPDSINEERRERIVVYVGRGAKPQVLPAKVVAKDSHHDLAILITERKIAEPLVLGNSEEVSPGTSIIFTGFPIGAVLGLYPATHHGIVAAVTPVAIPANSVGELTAQRIRMLKNRYNVFQLDAVAYPGNSGSPVLDLNSNEVIGVVNQVFVKRSKENVLSDPSAITYAIPSNHLKELLKKSMP